jgi:hypothetical protein
VARHQKVDFDALFAWAREEGSDPNDIRRLRNRADADQPT